METITAPPQEGTFSSDSHTGVTADNHSACSCRTVTEVLSRVGDKWSMQIVMGLSPGPMRFNELRRAIDGISQRMLTRTLRGLERDGLVGRKVTPSVPPRVDYSLTELGKSLTAPVQALGAWALTHRESIAVARGKFDVEAQAD
jgi:DNA-binding HxlR family transcriptional regulator